MSAAASDLSVLVADRTHPTCGACLRGWLEDGAETVTTLRPELRYVLIVSIDTHSHPRYLHAVELLADLAALQGRLLQFIDFAAHRYCGNPCPIDIRFLLEAAEHDQINRAIDRYGAAQLLHAQVGGNA